MTRMKDDHNVGTGFHYPAIHLFTLYRELGFREGMFPESERIGRLTVTLPLFSGHDEAMSSARCARSKRCSLNDPRRTETGTVRRHPGLQRGSRPGRAVRAPVPGARQARHPYEVVFVNDGSRDGSVAMLAEQFRARPDVTRVVLFNGNYGQHMAILAGFEATRGEIVVTLDADLQNPPEEIAKLVAKIHEGYDYVGSIRRERQDSAWRTVRLEADEPAARTHHQHPA